ncbi:MAG: PTS sugar transporter subunit IIA [Oscillospiraceae bacterium]|nr:PTS sugar transporter subunit IIA [Oscillospiraceae bacterium]
MRINLPETVTPDLIGIVIVSHSTFASGMVEASEVILGASENVATLGLELEDDPDEFGEEVANAISLFPAGCLVLVDMLGGTPFNQLMLSAERGSYRAVCGVNLGMLLEVLVARDTEDLETLAKNAYNTGLECIVDVEKLFEN